MKNNPIISVLMAVHNGQDYLSQSISSILQQSFDDFEFIIIDDASTDSSWKLISQAAQLDERIVPLHLEKNQGLATALNEGLAIAKGDFTARMDADDIACPERLQLQHAWFAQADDKFAVLGSARYVIDENGAYVKTITPSTNISEIMNKLENASPVAHPTVMFKTNIVREVDGYRAQFKKSQDFDLWIRIAEAGYLIANLKTPLIKFRAHDSSATRSKYKEQVVCHAFAKLSARMRKSGREDLVASEVNLTEQRYLSLEESDGEKRRYFLDLLARVRSAFNREPHNADRFCAKADQISTSFLQICPEDVSALPELKTWLSLYEKFADFSSNREVLKAFASIVGKDEKLADSLSCAFKKIMQRISPEAETDVKARKGGTRIFLTGGEGINWALDEDLRLLSLAIDKSDCLDLVVDSRYCDIVHSVYLRKTASFNDDQFADKCVVTSLTGDVKRFFYEGDSFSPAVRKSNFWSAYSKFGENQLRGVGLPVERINYMVDQDIFRKLNQAEFCVDNFKKKYNIPPSAYVIGSFQRDGGDGGRLDEPKMVKGPDKFARIVAAARDRGVPVHVLLAGPRRHWMRKRLTALNIPFTFVGNETGKDDLEINTLDRRELNELYNVIDLYIVASRSEAGPHAILEACASETMVLSSRVGIAADVLDASNIFDTESDAAELMLRTYEAESNTDQIKKNLNIIQTEHSVKAVSEKLVSLYSKALANKKNEDDPYAFENSDELRLNSIDHDKYSESQFIEAELTKVTEDNLKKTIGELELEISNTPKNLELLDRLWQLYNDSGDYLAAASRLGLAISLDRENWKRLYQYSLLLAKVSRESDALEVAKELVSMHPSNGQLRRHVSNLQNKIGLKHEAIESASAAVLLDPDDYSHRMHYARMLYNCDYFEEALEAAELAASYGLFDHRCYNLLGESATKVGDNIKAAEAYRKALILQPGHSSYTKNLNDALKNVER